MLKSRIFIRQGCAVSVFFILFQGCNNHNELADSMSVKFKNEVFKELDTAAYNPVFRKLLEEKRGELKYGSVISAYYKSHNYQSVFIFNFLPKDDLKILADRLAKAPEHGLDPKIFHYTELKQLVDKFYDKKSIKTLDEAYKNMALLELQSAESLISYSNALKYGIVKPRKIFPRYYMETLEPDSISILNIFDVHNMKEYLDSIQPKNHEYEVLQKALAENYVYPDLSAKETKKIIQLNLERLRWKNKPATDRYVWVNIADYTLKFVEEGKTKLVMKVCVGRNTTGKNGRQTPQISSEIYNVQVNPVWNIPESIIKNEIYGHVSRNPSYLANHRISIYKGGKKVSANEVNWSGGSKGRYAFRQAPGDYNSLGKIKFQFLNASSVYLHDTPAKSPFKLTVRAISHGCVRLEKPAEFAKALFGEGAKFKLIEKELKESNPTARDIPVKPKVPVYLDYMTCFVGDSSQIQIRPDVYKLDKILYSKMKSRLATKAAL